MRCRFFLLNLLFLWSSFSMLNTFAQSSPTGNLDQEQSEVDNNFLGGFSNTGSEGVWQSFTAGITGQLTDVAINVSTECDLILKIYSGDGELGDDGYLSTDNLIYQQSINNSFYISGWYTMNINGLVNVVEGQQYTFEVITEPTVGCYRLYKGNYNSNYSGGRSHLHFYAPSSDLGFRTYVQATNNFNQWIPILTKGSFNKEIITNNISSISNAPNPFTTSTNIEYTLTQTSQVDIAVYDVNGRLIKQILTNEQQTAGQHQLSFDGSDLVSGVYLLVIQSGETVKTHRMLLTQ